MVEFFLSLPTWNILRVLGMASYALLFIGIGSGTIYSMPVFANGKKTIYRLHAAANSGGVICGILHALFLVIDTYMPFSWTELLVPFASHNKPLFDGLGTLTLYGTLVLLLTTDLRNQLGKKLWRAIHLLSYPIYAIALLHGVGSGTDTRVGGIRLFYFVTAAVIVVLFLLRLMMGGSRGAHSARRGRRETGVHAPVQAE